MITKVGVSEYVYLIETINLFSKLKKCYLTIHYARLGMSQKDENIICFAFLLLRDTKLGLN